MTKGTAPAGNLTYDGMTNRITNSGFSYDANGNLLTMPGMLLGYDYDNRLTSATGSSGTYVYDPDNRRVAKMAGTLEVYFYGVDGRKLGTYQVSSGFTSIQPVSENLHFAGRLIKSNNNWVVTDRLGSVVKSGTETLRYFPWGEERSTTTQNRDKFATYHRDSTGLDYALNRYYSSSHGRFLTPDPAAPGDPAAPQSWNYYAYVQGDPITLNDPEGLEACRDVQEMRNGVPTGRTIADLLNASTDLGLLATTVFVESAMSDSRQGAEEMGAIAAVIINRYNLVNGYIKMNRADGTAQAPPRAWGPADGTLRSIVVNPTQFQVWQGPGGTLTADAQRRLDVSLDSRPDSRWCKALLNAIGTANGMVSFMRRNVGFVDDKTGLMYTGFNSFDYEQKYDWEQRIGTHGSANVFYGVPPLIPVPSIRATAEDDRRVPRPRSPGGGR